MNPHDDSKALNECVQALDYMALALRSADPSAVMFAAFVWGQNDNKILTGDSTWLDQCLPPIVVGGGNVEAHNRVRPAKRPLHPPLPGAPFLEDALSASQIEVTTVIVDTLKGEFKKVWSQNDN